jgi:NRPS condensation-like uncharacterized protein
MTIVGNVSRTYDNSGAITEDHRFGVQCVQYMHYFTVQYSTVHYSMRLSIQYSTVWNVSSRRIARDINNEVR